MYVVELTPVGKGAVATLLVEGAGAMAAVAAEFHGRGGGSLAPAADDRPLYGRFGPPPREQVVVRRHTSESVEIHCHGGRAAVERITQCLVARGARPIAWQEWNRARGVDPIASAALEWLAQARTGRVATILLDQYWGALRQEIEALAAALDVGDSAAVGRRLSALRARGELGRHLIEPWRVVVAGPANAGKSSLVNALVGFDRAIVHPMAGTTRDVVTAGTAIDGWPVELADTAGLRTTDQPLEQAGIALARQQIAAADLLLLVFDVSRPWSADDEALAGQWPGAQMIFNKSDLPAATPAAPLSGLATSAVTGEGIQRLLQVIAGRLVANPPPPGAAVPFAASHRAALEKSADAWAVGDPATARAALMAML